MDFFISHWHCIVPIVGIVIAICLLSDKGKDRSNKD